MTGSIRDNSLLLLCILRIFNNHSGCPYTDCMLIKRNVFYKEMLFSFKNKYHYTYLNTYIALYFRTPKLPVKHTHNPKKIVSIPLTLVPSLANYPLPHTPPSLGVSPSHTQTCHSRQHIKSGAGGREYVCVQVRVAESEGIRSDSDS